MRRVILVLLLMQFPAAGQAPAPSSDIGPVLIRKAECEYTSMARREKISGIVILTGVIELDGQADRLKVAQAIGYGLDGQAIKCVKKWRFRPAMKDGRPVPAPARVEVNFKLKEGDR